MPPQRRLLIWTLGPRTMSGRLRPASEQYASAVRRFTRFRPNREQLQCLLEWTRVKRLVVHSGTVARWACRDSVDTLFMQPGPSELTLRFMDFSLKPRLPTKSGQAQSEFDLPQVSDDPWRRERFSGRSTGADEEEPSFAAAKPAEYRLSTPIDGSCRGSRDHHKSAHVLELRRAVSKAEVEAALMKAGSLSTRLHYSGGRE